MYYVYVLKCSDNTLYKGYTSNWGNRLYQHINGSVKSTKSRLPVELIYIQGFKNKTDAIREENYLKTGKGREQLKLKLETYLKRAGVVE